MPTDRPKTEENPNGSTGPKGITDDEIAAALEKSAGIVKLAAQTLGVERKGLWRRIKSTPRLLSIHEDEDDEKLDIAEAIVVTSLVKDKDLGTAKWWLERKGAKRGFANKSEVAATVDLAAALQELSDDDFYRLGAAAVRPEPPEENS